MCDFTSTWKGGFNIHIGRKHKLLPLDRGDFSSELNELDDCYEGSKHYWKSGYLGQGYQAFIDAKKGCVKVHWMKRRRKFILMLF